MLEYFLIGISILALLCIVFEEVIHLNKAKSTLFLGCIAWLTLYIHAAGDTKAQQAINHSLDENLLEIATLWLFLMATMTFVAYLNAKGMIQAAVQKIFPTHLSIRRLMILVALFAMLLSAICDNVTATLVSLGLIQAYDLDRKTRIQMAALVVFAVNSGGVALITGDVTTLMIFLKGHVTMPQLITLVAPAAAAVVFLALVFSIGQKGQVKSEVVERQFDTVDILIAAAFFATIISTMLFNILFAVPPVLTFLTGLSVMFLIGRTAKTDAQQTKILEYIRQVEFDTLLFFLGILLLVGMLKEIGVLDQLAHLYAQYDPKISNYVAGSASALLDNVPLTAALLKAQPALSTSEWLGLTYAVGVGGSLLAIGSAAGIIVMSKLKEVTFAGYLRHTPALAAAYTLGYGLTLLIAQATY
ncbi:sodium:proton antiporter NhaD [Biformimicrobium ophioploci]|uniref:Sodium:proton antiporter NhaD n=1 Tax=Biformimicrobium ophioploci TaxID=3036711 RepID=A0ABQ6LXC9_9GAMM|nr:sodium:proton antiporter NhaD [Microbulbifer sp. NKW57]GMG86774.1 sodium:proton antiporter NhaD [Microbulbifer sp. NKW57]